MNSFVILLRNVWRVALSIFLRLTKQTYKIDNWLLLIIFCLLVVWLHFFERVVFFQVMLTMDTASHGIQFDLDWVIITGLSFLLILLSLRAIIHLSFYRKILTCLILGIFSASALLSWTAAVAERVPRGEWLIQDTDYILDSIIAAKTGKRQLLYGDYNYDKLDLFEDSLLVKDARYQMDFEPYRVLMLTPKSFIFGKKQDYFRYSVSKTIHTSTPEKLNLLVKDIVPVDFYEYMLLVEKELGAQEIKTDILGLNKFDHRILQNYLRWRFPGYTIGIIYHNGAFRVEEFGKHHITASMAEFVSLTKHKFLVFGLDDVWYERPYDIHRPRLLFQGFYDMFLYRYNIIDERKDNYTDAIKILLRGHGVWGQLEQDPYFLYESGRKVQAENAISSLSVERANFIRTKLGIEDKLLSENQ